MSFVCLAATDAPQWVVTKIKMRLCITVQLIETQTCSKAERSTKVKGMITMIVKHDVIEFILQENFRI